MCDWRELVKGHPAKKCLMIDSKRLAEITAHTVGSLSETAMWATWQNSICENADKFAAHPYYLAQQDGPQFTQENWERVTKEAMQSPLSAVVDRYRELDVPYGAKVVQTACGAVTRAWLDSIIESDFINRHVPLTDRSIRNDGRVSRSYAVARHAALP